MIDAANEEYVTQGRVLKTKTTSKWSLEEFESSNYIEACMLFINFSSMDEGRSRVMVLGCSTPQEALNAKRKHNAEVRKILENNNE